MDVTKTLKKRKDKKRKSTATESDAAGGAAAGEPPPAAAETANVSAGSSFKKKLKRQRKAEEAAAAASGDTTTNGTAMANGAASATSPEAAAPAANGLDKAARKALKKQKKAEVAAATASEAPAASNGLPPSTDAAAASDSSKLSKRERKRLKAEAKAAVPADDSSAAAASTEQGQQPKKKKQKAAAASAGAFLAAQQKARRHMAEVGDVSLATSSKPIVRSTYTEHPATAAQSTEDLAAFREQRSTIVAGCDLKPVRAFEHSSEHVPFGSWQVQPGCGSRLHASHGVVLVLLQCCHRKTSPACQPQICCVACIPVHCCCVRYCSAVPVFEYPSLAALVGNLYERVHFSLNKVHLTFSLETLNLPCAQALGRSCCSRARPSRRHRQSRRSAGRLLAPDATSSALPPR